MGNSAARKIEIVPDGPAWVARGAELFHDRVLSTLKQRPKFAFVASGGGTPRPVYEAIASQRPELPWQRIHVFFGDERNVGPDHPESNFHMLSESLLSKVPIPKENVHRFHPELNDPEEVAREYESEIRAFFELKRSSDKPFFDLEFLGLGPDGHTASLFPDGSPGAEIDRTEPDRLVIAPWVRHLNAYRFSLTPAALRTAQEVVFLATGAEKAHVVRATIDESDGGNPYPAQSVRSARGRTTWLVDQSAAADLQISSLRATAKLHQGGQSLWLDNITRRLLDSGQIARYVAEYSVTGLTSNPSIFDKAVESGEYDSEIRAKAARGITGEDLFFDLAIEDLRRAADLFRPVHEQTDGVDGWVSLEVSPLLAHDAGGTFEAARKLYEQAGRPNLYVKIPGTLEGRAAIEECIAAGIPINVTLLFSVEQYRGAAEAYLRGIERRIAAGLSPRVSSVASVFMSRWDRAVNPLVPAELKNRLALAVGRAIYRAYRELMASGRWQRLANRGARLQRLLWASTSTKDAETSETFYVQGLFAPLTVDTMPDQTLTALFELASDGKVADEMPADGGNCDAMIARFEAAGIDVAALAEKLQSEGAKAFDESWRGLLRHIEQQVKP